MISCRGVHAGYGALTVVRNLSLEVNEGEIVLLLGPNGAGKTTTLLSIAGLLPTQRGEITVCGYPVSAERPHLMPRRGLSFVPDDRALVTGLTVRDNLRLAVRRGGRSIDDILDLLPTLRRRLRVRAGSLSGGEQQMLAVGRALLPAPRVLAIDEMSMGLAPIIVQQLLEAIRTIVAQAAVGVLLVEQHVALALQAADRAYALVHGEVVLHASTEELRLDVDRLTEAYLGRALTVS
ncbi:ABC transporter ATP-binding protein [Cryptosporangium sp. NPDC051539]|uniref:ABC transporter ATP-binding protein n=1 Tax=Cryptosporangium sp. NPDC051539 TaxID=3363962 RepID=UPI0037A9A4D8